MSTASGSPAHQSKVKKTTNTNHSSAYSSPTTFFLKSEKDMERDTQRGRRESRASASTQAEEDQPRTSSTSETEDSRYGVQSLADTISSAFSLETELSRTNSNATEPSDDLGGNSTAIPNRKRKAGNPVHPRIMATGQRIISAEHVSTQASLAASPNSLRSAESPYRTHLQRRGSGASSVNLNSQPPTPLKMSPRPESAMLSTPRSGSPKSFRLSDEEGSVADETGSQAVQSSSGEDDDDAEASTGDSSMPQLVMPSIAIPTRRPFTERGRRIGKLRVMVVGPTGVGKTSLIQNILRCCEDVVHVGAASTSTPHHSTTNGNDTYPTVEVLASTRPYPTWWTDFEDRRMLLRRKSIGEGVLERNLCLLDTPGSDSQSNASSIVRYAEQSMRRVATIERMNDSELVSMLSGDGGTQLDAVLWLLDAEHLTNSTASDEQKQLLRTLSSLTNIIPLITRADLVDQNELERYRQEARDIFLRADGNPYEFGGCISATSASDGLCQPYMVSSALSDDTETMDASVLMSSQYLQPLVQSELGAFIENFFDLENVARMRHLSAVKFLLWRQANLGQHIDLHKQTVLNSPRFEPTAPSTTSLGSVALNEDPSKVLVPYGTSSYFRSVSPSATSESSAPIPNTTHTSAYALARYNEQQAQHTAEEQPFRQVRLAKWAQDLQRGLHNERKRYQQMYAGAWTPSDWASSTDDAEKSEKANNHNALVTRNDDRNNRPARGTLGGDVAVFDPRDPLGVLAFSQAFRRRGWFVLQVAGGCGVLGAVAFWIVRNWAEVQEWCGIGGPVVAPLAVAVPPPRPATSTRGVWEDVDWRGLLGLAR